MKYLFFDLDGTLCVSKQKLKDDMIEALGKLTKKYEVVIVSGAELSRMNIQAPIKGITLMSQNGNEVVYKNKVLWRNELKNKHEIENHIKILIKEAGLEIGEDMIDDRGSQISLSFVGHNALLEKKLAYDLDRKKRISMLEQFPFPGAVIGGTTCIDYIPFTKGQNIARFIKKLAVKATECLYVGDAFTNYGNDATVLGVIPVHQVDSPEATLKFIKQL